MENMQYGLTRAFALDILLITRAFALHITITNLLMLKEELYEYGRYK